MTRAGAGRAEGEHQFVIGQRLEIGDPALCLRVFKSNRDAGLLLFAGLLADAAMRAA